LTLKQAATFEAFVVDLERSLAQPIEIPEPSLTLELEACAGDVRRTVSRAHQRCFLHAWNLLNAGRVKVAHTGRFYLNELHARNPLGIYSAARVALELHAFHAYVYQELVKIVLPTAPLLERATRFFDLLIRARFSTKDPKKKEVLRQAGVSDVLLQHFQIKASITAAVTLASGRFDWLPEHYAVLCDFVHSSLSSQTVSTKGGRLDRISQAGSLTIATPREGLINVHGYPSEAAFELAVEGTRDRTLACLTETVAVIDRSPMTPTTEAERLEHTGNKMGMREASFVTAPISRNALCYCGRGKRFKNCHGRVN
jgi:hypothetical protein